MSNDVSRRTGRVREVRGWLTAALGLGCFLAGVWATHGRHAHASHAPSSPGAPRGATSTGAPVRDEGPVELHVLYSTETAAWLREQSHAFEQANPTVRVRLQGLGSLDAERAIVDGRARPAVWIPADNGALELLESDWRARHGGGARVLSRDEGQTPRPLVLTPMVFAVWQSRASVLGESSSVLAWSRLAALARSPRGWASLGAPTSWGGLKFGHTDPTRSHAGLQALVLMAYGFRGRADRLVPGDVASAPFEAFVHAFEAADPAADRGTTNSGEFAQTVALQGPGRYDAVLLYESQAIATLEMARGRWGEDLRVFYPSVNVWSDHPLCVLQGDWVRERERAAAQRFEAFLRSSPAQRAAVRHGFRPADATVAIADDDAANPFVRYRAQGVRIALTQVADAPSPMVLEALVATWRRATGR